MAASVASRSAWSGPAGSLRQTHSKALYNGKGNPAAGLSGSLPGCLLSAVARRKSARRQNVTVRLPSSCSSILTQVASPGSRSSISSGHSMKQSAPL